MPPETGAAAGAVSAIDPGVWHRLDARMLLLLPLQEILKNLPFLAVLVLAGSGSGRGPLWGLIGLAVTLAAGTLRWFTTRYQIGVAQVQVRRGLFRRRTMTVPRDRIRTVDLTAHVLHRIVGLASITIGTGRTDRKEDRGLKLDGLSAQDASWIREELLHRRSAVAAPTATTSQAGPAATELARWQPRWIAYGPFTLSGAVTVLAVVGFGLEIVNEGHLRVNRLGPIHSIIEQLGSASPTLLALVALVAAVILIALASTLGYLLAFWNFRLIRQAGTLQVTRGLLTNRVISIDERRLRGIELSEPLLLRWVKGARCIAIATGLRVGRGAERGGSMLVPPAPERIAASVSAELLGSTGPVQAALLEHGPVARRRRFNRVLLVMAPVLVLLLILWGLGALPAWPWLAATGLLLLLLPVAWDRYRSLGHAVVGQCLVVRSGSLVRRRSMVLTEGIIGWNLHQSFFQRRARVVNLIATTAAGRQAYRLQDLTLPESIRVAEEACPGLLSPFLE
ncbi:MAG TPA: PH domain-containing protein [Candidatus Dormibacteraeota bacterium]